MVSFAFLLPLHWLFASICYASITDEGFMSKFTVGHHANAKYFFLFGDSYTRIGFDNSGDAPSNANFVGNPPFPSITTFPGTTTSGGLNWALILGSQYNDSLTFMYDYAYSGATIDKTLIHAPKDSYVRDINDQMSDFQHNMTVDGAPRWCDEHNSVFAVWFGQNDVYQVYNRSMSNPNATFDAVYDVYFKRMDELYEAGARNFLWIGVAPIDRSPLVLSSSKEGQTKVAELSRAFNDRLSARAQNFATSHAGIRWRYYDPAPAFNRVLDNPREYGAPNATCLALDGIECLWWNNYHPGIRIHEQIAADLAANETVRSLFKATL